LAARPAVGGPDPDLPAVSGCFWLTPAAHLVIDSQAGTDPLPPFDRNGIDMGKLTDTAKKLPPFTYGVAAAIVVLLPVGLLHFLGDKQWVQSVFGGGKTIGFWVIGLLAILAVERIASSSTD